MSAFKSNVDVEYSVYSVLDPVDTKKKSKVVSHKESAPAAATQGRIARAAPGLRPPEPRPVSAGVLAGAGRGKDKADIGSKAKTINLAVANERGAAGQADKKGPVKSAAPAAVVSADGALLASAGAPARAAAAPPVLRQAAMPLRTSEAARSAYDSGGSNHGGSHGDLGGEPRGTGPNLPPPKRGDGPAPSRRPMPPGRRFQLERRKTETSALSGSLPHHPSWNMDVRAPDRELLMLEQDNAIHRLKFGDGMPLLPPESASARSADGSGLGGRGPLGEGDESSARAKGLVSSRTPRDVTPADIYAPHRIRSTKNASGTVVNGRGKGLFHIAKLVASKSAEPSNARRKSPERRGSSPNRGSPSGAAAPVAPSGRARHRQHVDHDNIRNHFIHGNDALQGHMGIHISEEQQYNTDITKRPNGIHASPWNFSELLLDDMLADERLLPAPVNRMIPMFDRKSSSASGADRGSKTPDSARSAGSPSLGNNNVSNGNRGLPVSSTAPAAGASYKSDAIHKEKSLSKMPDISIAFPMPVASKAAAARRSQLHLIACVDRGILLQQTCFRKGS